MAVSVKIAKGGSRVTAARARRHLRVRKRVQGTASRPRMVVSRSSRHIVVQVIDDQIGHTLASASTMERELRDLQADKTTKARRVGELVGQRARQAGVAAVVFDRGGYQYHGRVAAVADGARESGLEF